LVPQGGRGIERASRECVLDCGQGVRLQGFHAPVAGRERGLVVMLHGWEGSSSSTYVLSAAERIHARGYAVFRLNFRDHGTSHALNRELFHSCRILEVVGAVRALATRFADRPLFLVGFSLGGNFALRVALRAPAAGIPLTRVVAVNPAISPSSVLDALERWPNIYERYFIGKWRRSLQRKQKAFPGLYDFREWHELRGLREQTRYLVERHSDFATLDEYLDGYSIAGRVLAGLEVPSTLITSTDDPIVPVEDVRAMRASNALTIEIQQGGGHCGYVETLMFRRWIDRRIVEVLEADTATLAQGRPRD